MNLEANLITKLILIFPVFIFLIGVSVMLIRKKLAWNLMGQLIALKATVAGAFLWSQQTSTNTEMIFITLVALGLLPACSMVGLLVIQRAGRFGGTSDSEEEQRLRN